MAAFSCGAAMGGRPAAYPAVRMLAVTEGKLRKLGRECALLSMSCDSPFSGIAADWSTLALARGGSDRGKGLGLPLASKPCCGCAMSATFGCADACCCCC